MAFPEGEEQADPTVTATAGASGVRFSQEPNAPPPTAVPARVGPYVLTGLLGSGGMGVVHSAFDERLKAHVALKSLPASMDDMRVRALKREFRAVSDFAHQHVVRMYDLFADATGWYVVMELVEGDDWVSFVRGASPWDSRRARRALGELLLGLHALHEAGWVHRDIKASNVLVERKSERVVILDFGLAEAVQVSAVREARVFGTRSHMAPELLRGGAATPATDLFAAGVMLSRAIPGATRMDGSPDLEALQAGRVADRELGEWCLSLLAADPKERLAAPELLARLGVSTQSVPKRLAASIVGRERELARLEQALADAMRGGVVLVELQGAAGIGKSALAGSFLQRVDRVGRACVLRTRCHVHERIPFNAVDGLVDGLAGEIAAGGEGLAGAVRDLPLDRAIETFPALSILQVAVAPDEDQGLATRPAQRRAEAFDQLAGLFGILRRERPVVLFVDDAHWGDADSAHLLRALLAGGPVHGVHGVLALWSRRSDFQQSAFVAVLERAALEAGEEIRRVVLEPLDEAAAERLVRTELPGLGRDELRVILDEARGSPLLLAKSARDGGRARGLRGSSVLQSVVDTELEQSEPAVQRLLRIVAIASAPIALEVAASATGGDLDMYRALFELRSRRLVVLHDDAGRTGRAVEMYHDQLRAPLLSSLPESEQPRLHRALAVALEASEGASPGLTSVHFHAAGELAAAARHAELAALQADSALAFGSAVQHYRNALAWSGESETAERLSIRLAEALFNAGQCAESARVYKEARCRAPPDLDREIAVRQATAWFSAGHLDEASECVRPLLAELGLSLPEEKWLLPAIAAKVFRLRFGGLDVRLEPTVRHDEMREFRADLCWSVGQGFSMFLSKRGAYFALQSLFEALPMSDPRRIGRALAFVGGICANLGGKMASWGEAWLGRAEAIARQHSDAYVLGWCHVWRANSELVRGNFVRAVDLAERGIDLMEHGPYAMSWECHTARCFALMARERRGNLAEVDQRAQRVLQKAALHDDRYGRVMFSLFSAQVAIARGEIERARALATAPMEAWTKDSFTIQHFYAVRVHTYADLYEGRARAAADRLSRSWKAIQASDASAIPSASLDAELLRAHVELGLGRARAMDAMRHADETRRIAKAVRSRSAEASAHAHLLVACSHAIEGNTEASLQASAKAAESFERLDMDLLAAVARRCRAAHAGDTEAAKVEESRLQALGVTEPTRWIAVVAPGFQ